MRGLKRAISVGALFCLAVGVAQAQSVTGQRPRFESVARNLSELVKEFNFRYDGPVSTVYTKDNAPAGTKLEDLALVESLSQYGITWHFDRKVRAGKFVTGDWYVVGPVTVVKIDPKPLFGKEVTDSGWQLVNDGSIKEGRYDGKWARNGSMLNQIADDKGTHQAGYDSRLSNDYYEPSLFTNLPIAMKPGDALVSTVSAPEPINHAGHGQPVMAAAVLTCLRDPVPADAFRPSYCDRQQTIRLARNLKRGLLYRLPRTPNAPNTLTEWARWFQRPWLDVMYWGYASPELNMPRYGQSVSHGSSHSALLLHMDYPDVEKEQLLIHYVQYGIDLWGIAEEGHPKGFKGWQGHGGFGGGRKCALVFAGILLGDDQMRSPNTKFPKLMFGEDTQTDSGKSWSGFDVVFRSHPSYMKDFPEKKHPKDVFGTNEWGPWNQSESYRRCCTSTEWAGEALAMHLMRAEKYWNHDPFFAYVDRWMDKEDIAATAKTIAGVKKVEVGYEARMPKSSKFAREVWDKYRHSLPEPLVEKK